MPCFKGVAVSVHAEGAPLPEYSIQKQIRSGRITSYVPVPEPRIPKNSTTNKPEQSKFAISITLLTSGLPVPYSTPKPTPDNPYPTPKLVAGSTADYRSVKPAIEVGKVAPYFPLTTSDNETIAAYIYFDGREKEEVATLLRPGEETWVNSRWVSVPEAEGGGLAEREFLFREVGLERWLNGLDLESVEGTNAAAKAERRRQKLEKRRKKIKDERGSDDELADIMTGQSGSSRHGMGRYNEDALSSVVPDDNIMLSDSDSSDDDEPPTAAGQIKVTMFRVLASGEIKKGEYSPQFDAHDDDGNENGGKDVRDVDHTTSFAKPKTLDPQSISTQTVTGIDGPDKPYVTFTFLYRGESK